MMRRVAMTTVIGLVLVGPALAGTETWIDDFEGGSNPSQWAFIRGGDVIEMNGGNPGAWLSQPLYDTFAPTLETAFGVPTPFVGDYRAIEVSSIGIDARTDRIDFGDGSGFNFSILLRDTNGTPNDFDDDDMAYYVGPNIPLEGEGWVHYDFDIPSTSTDAVPAGWKGAWVGDPENFRPGVEWSDVITSVDRVEFWWLDPALFAIFQQWGVGADNISITYEAMSTPVEETSWSVLKDHYAR